jgi:predicted acetyltransferase
MTTDPTLVKATIDDYPVIQNMARFYVYDMSRYCGRMPSRHDWSCPPEGLFECVDLKPYFIEPDRHGFYIKVGGEKAGFALINKKGSTPDVDWNVGEFFILAKFQSTGIGKQAAERLFEKFPGVWETAVMLENTGAYPFWSKVVASYTGGSFTEEKKLVPDPEPHEMIIFRFESPLKAYRPDHDF